MLFEIFDLMWVVNGNCVTLHSRIKGDMHIFLSSRYTLDPNFRVFIKIHNKKTAILDFKTELTVKIPKPSIYSKTPSSNITNISDL